MRIRHLKFTQVVVPSRPDSVNSAGLDRPLHQLVYGASRGFSVQFDEMPKTILELETSDGVVGIGEFYRGLSPEQLRPIAQSLVGMDVASLNLQDLPIPEGRVYDGFECAILDAVGKRHQLPLYSLLGGRFRSQVECSYWTGHRTIDDAARKAAEGQKLGFNCIKFKCDLADPVVEWCEAIRESCGEHFRVILDPNRRWRTAAETLRRAEALHAVGNLLCLEDPLPRWNWSEYHFLRTKSAIPIAIHISLPYMEMGQLPTDVVQAVRYGACDFFNFNGGCFPMMRLAAVSQSAEIPFWHGSEVDLGILEASYVHKAAAASHCTLPSDIFGRLVREHDLLSSPLTFDGRFVKVPEGPGLGIVLDQHALAHYAIAVFETF